ncbi:MAG TPA: amidohydrolase family protein [Solirubrobacterales bacterium]|nr:amidohydrolase family protein [Solirubrobacterales bacterium]
MSLHAAIEAELAALDGVAPFDCHAHTGADIDGSARSCEDHLASLAPVGARSVIFPFCVEDGYEAENRRVIEECRRYPQQLVPFARMDPRVTAPRDAAEALAAGARGFKLHPRAEDFRLDDPGVEAICSVAAEARAPVLIHAGAGVGSFGETVTDLAARHRDCPLILAHAAVSDLAWLWQVAPGHPNLFFDTSWWNPSDLIALFALIPPGQVLFGSDEPYMDFGTVLAIMLRCARFAGLGPEAIELVAGGQLELLLAGEAPLDAGPAPGAPAAELSPTESRLATLLAAAGGCMLGGGDPSLLVELAHAAIGVDGSAIPAGTEPLIEELIDEASSGEAPWAVAMALTVLVTPGVESTVLTG